MKTGNRLWLAALLAVLGLAGLLTAQLGPNRHRIETSLTDSSVQALAAAGQPGARISFTGRDAVVVTRSEAEAEQARKIVTAIDGVRTVSIAIDAPEIVRTPPALLLATADGRAVLTGAVPDAEVKAVLRDAAAAAFGADRIDDRVTVADTVATDPALTALPILLRSLPGKIADFAVRLESGALTISGTAPDEVTRTALATAADHAAVPVTNRTTVAPLQPRLSAVPPVTFRSGGAELTPESADSLREVADLLTANPSARIRVEGHTDSRGAKETNLALSRDRADAVRSGLLKLGVGEDRLIAIGYGETRPKVDNDTWEHRAQNRRVELTVITA